MDVDPKLVVTTSSTAWRNRSSPPISNCSVSSSSGAVSLCARNNPAPWRSRSAATLAPPSSCPRTGSILGPSVVNPSTYEPGVARPIHVSPIWTVCTSRFDDRNIWICILRRFATATSEAKTPADHSVSGTSS
ncbi:Uncharacterised protein [Mycobacteroides abscessus]|nr:Uncharacterised protein [Mycobacteroides abscessus]